MHRESSLVVGTPTKPQPLVETLRELVETTLRMRRRTFDRIDTQNIAHRALARCERLRDRHQIVAALDAEIREWEAGR